MGDRTSIEWTDASWNPIRGCTRVSGGCDGCYAIRDANMRVWGRSLVRKRADGRPDWNGVVQLIESRLAAPLRWRKPRRAFVASGSDPFHHGVSDEWLDRMFAVMALTPHITYQLLTKRPERMRRYLTAARECVGYAGDPVVETQKHVAWRAGQLVENGDVACDAVSAGPWPLPNVWLGTSVEDQATADARIPLLLDSPAVVRFVSYEPALGPVDFGAFLRCPSCGYSYRDQEIHGDHSYCSRNANGQMGGILSLDWIIVGGESGSGARPFDVAWARSTIAQVRAAGVPVFVKQLGARPRNGMHASGTGNDLGLDIGPGWVFEDTHEEAYHLHDRKGGDMAEWPEDLRVREFPEVARA